jgi:DNA-binding MarR family transcriptional regulator
METAAGDRVPERLRSTPSWLITHTATAVGRLVGEAFTSIGARRYHYALLAALAEFGPACQAALGRRCGIDRSDVVAAINELAGDGQVVRSPDPADRRRNVITVTTGGLRQLERADAALAGVQESLLGPLSAEERRELVRLLTLVYDRVSAVSP